ncbi:MAG: glycerate kinase, partial [Bacteroidales bacterium]|nr:glycerate kinase [Bacteroidales bacterium]
DLVLTGEGRFDAQTATGKLPARVLAAARRSGAGPRAVCLCGSVDAAAVPGSGFDAVIPVTPPEMSLSEALRPETAAALLRAAARACVANVPK